MPGTGSFYTDVIAKDPRFKSPLRINDPLLLEPVTRAAVMAIVSEAAKQGIDLRVFETYRSATRQQELYTQGRSQLLTIGCHHFGVACDLVIYDDNNQPTWAASYAFLGLLAAKHGLVWGGPGPGNLDIGDLDHVQRCAVKDQPFLFGGQWYPASEYSALGAYHDGPQDV